ncbi:MAG: hypothetical protein EOP04_32620, partial [Proteobacteria bacterium]
MSSVLRIVLVLLIISCASMVKAEPIRLEAKEHGRWLGSKLELLKSDANDLESVKSKDGWFKVDKTVPSFGYTNDSYWAKFSFEQPRLASETFYLVFYGPFEDLDLYTSTGNEFAKTSQGMYLRELDTNFRYPVFKLILPPGTTQFFVKENAVAPHFPVRIFSAQEFETFRYREHLFLMFVIGIALILLLFAIIATVKFPGMGNFLFLASYVSCILFTLYVTGGGRPISHELGILFGVDLFPLEQLVFRNWMFLWGSTEFLSLLFGWYFLEQQNSVSKPVRNLQYLGLAASFCLATVSY